MCAQICIRVCLCVSMYVCKREHVYICVFPFTLMHMWFSIHACTITCHHVCAPLHDAHVCASMCKLIRTFTTSNNKRACVCLYTCLSIHLHECGTCARVCICEVLCACMYLCVVCAVHVCVCMHVHACVCLVRVWTGENLEGDKPPHAPDQDFESN